MLQINFDDNVFQVDLEDGHSSFAGGNEMDGNLCDLHEHYLKAQIKRQFTVKPSPRSTSANLESVILMPVFLLK